MERWLEQEQDKVWCGKDVEELERAYDRYPEQKIKMETVSKLIMGKSVLDVGCGFGYLNQYLASGVNYVGVDQSEEMLAKARLKYPKANFVQGNLYNLKVPKFDTVVCLDVLHHQPALEPGFSNLMKHAKKCLIVSLWINDRKGRHRRKQYKGGRGEIVTWFTENELQEKFKGLKYEVIKKVGYVWKDIYRFTL